ncbi:zinc-dependent alcohol dehydrogenase [Mycolicibacterium llatzerense]|uniref:zinc-dependent alcohol dehydrogenase n=1 Tax=Mycolicibacterium llatzerense TaxID=280871 RepID=UPI0021B5FD9A|nr:zinc-binding dehydrogenase [Mycolicibacterium llatzerense]MCT7361749.1 theronine dehydrogenase [Mycolicibacterium llatzerense]MCT7369089.1 theronine dehydrogenase [Mycolicibacterium llatzerense]
MKAAVVTGTGTTDVIDLARPEVGPRDVLVKIRACGICGSDALYIAIGGLPPHQGRMPLGHEPAGEIVAVGGEVADLAVGDHVVVDPMATPGDIIGNGGGRGALAEYLLLTDAVRGTHLEVIPDHIPFEVAALNEPMAVARHAVNRCRPKPSDKVLIFGAGPIGLGAVLALKSLGVQHVAVADVVASRLETALGIGADAVINSAEENLAARLVELHGAGAAMFPGKADTDIYLDAAGVGAVIESAVTLAKKGATIGVVAVHKAPVPVDFLSLMSNEITILGSMGYPDEIFDVTSDLVANWQTYARIVSHTIPFDQVNEALVTAATPGAADKIVVTFD